MPQQADDCAQVLTGQVPVGKPHTLGCTNPMCRVVEYLPHSSKRQDQKCPACYGTPA